MVKYDREYGVATTIYFPLMDVAGASLQTGAAHAVGDTRISISGGAWGNTVNSFTNEGEGWYSLVLTAAEVSGLSIAINVVDQTAPPIWIDQPLIIETYGSTTSAQHDTSC